MTIDFFKWLFNTPEGHGVIIFGMFGAACIGCMAGFPDARAAAVTLWPIVLLKVKP